MSNLQILLWFALLSQSLFESLFLKLSRFSLSTLTYRLGCKWMIPFCISVATPIQYRSWNENDCSERWLRSSSRGNDPYFQFREPFSWYGHDYSNLYPFKIGSNHGLHLLRSKHKNILLFCGRHAKIRRLCHSFEGFWFLDNEGWNFVWYVVVYFLSVVVWRGWWSMIIFRPSILIHCYCGEKLTLIN